jgi:small subunit ribosomal protein S15
MITADNKAKAIAAVQKSEQDVGSAEVQVSVLTARIKEITEHLQIHKHDHMARRGLIQMVGQRKKLLGYLERKDFAGYKALITQLGLRK